MPRQRNLPFPRRRAKQPKQIHVSIRDRRALGVYVKRFLKGLQSSPDPQRTAKRGLAALFFPYPQREAMQGLGALTSVSAIAVVFDVARRTVQEPQQCLDFQGLSSIALDVAKASRWLGPGNQDPIHNESALRVLAGGICELLTDTWGAWLGDPRSGDSVPWAGNALMAVKNLATYPPLYAAALAFCTVERLAAKRSAPDGSLVAQLTLLVSVALEVEQGKHLVYWPDNDLDVIYRCETSADVSMNPSALLE